MRGHAAQPPTTLRRLLAALAALVLIPVVASLRHPPNARASTTGGPPLAYAADGSTIEVVNAATNAPVANIGTIVSGLVPRALAITPDARFVLVLLAQAANLASAIFPAQSAAPNPELVALNVGSNTVAGTVSLPLTPGPVAVATAPGGATAYVLEGTGGAAILPVSISPSGQLSLGSAVTLPLPAPASATDLAVSPDGQTLYAVGGNADQTQLVALPPGGGKGPSVRLPRGATRVAVTPDGATAYIVMPAGAGPGAVEEVSLSAAALSLEGSIASPDEQTSPAAEAIATLPNGASTLWVADSGTNSLFSVPIPTPAGFVPAPIPMFTIPSDLAAVPDGSALEVTTQRIVVGRISVPGGAGSKGCAPLTSCPPGGGAIAITPDERPVAGFTAAPAPPGLATSFDAAGASSVSFGSIAKFAWDFGDGSSGSGATVSHVYSTPGPRTVTLVETTAAGTSDGTTPPSTIFTGHTTTRNGGPQAETSQTITIPTPPNSPPATSPSPTSRTSPPASPTPGHSPSPGPGASPSPSAPAVTATLTLNPTVGPPGAVVAASGTGFARNSTVTLSWVPGLGTAVATTDANGNFFQRMLVLPNDTLGYRNLTTSSPSLQAQFLVNPPSVDPAGRNQILFRH